MEKFVKHTGNALPLRRSNVDTDQIIPAVYLKRITKNGFEDGLFAAWRNADIFRGNSQKMGLLTVILPQADIEKIWQEIESKPDTQITVDLGAKTVAYAKTTLTFDIDDYTRWRLMEGLDDIGLTFTKIDQVSRFEEKRLSFKPKTLPIR